MSPKPTWPFGNGPDRIAFFILYISAAILVILLLIIIPFLTARAERARIARINADIEKCVAFKREEKRALEAHRAAVLEDYAGEQNEERKHPIHPIDNPDFWRLHRRVSRGRQPFRSRETPIQFLTAEEQTWIMVEGYVAHMNRVFPRAQSRGHKLQRSNAVRRPERSVVFTGAVISAATALGGPVEVLGREGRFEWREDWERGLLESEEDSEGCEGIEGSEISDIIPAGGWLAGPWKGKERANSTSAGERDI